MGQVAVDADYERRQTTYLELASDALDEFPDPDDNVKKAEKVVVQAHPENNGWLCVGEIAPYGLVERSVNGTPAPIGDFLSPGQQLVLAGRDLSRYRAIGSAEGGQVLIVKYLAGAN